ARVRRSCARARANTLRPRSPSSNLALHAGSYWHVGHLRAVEWKSEAVAKPPIEHARTQLSTYSSASRLGPPDDPCRRISLPHGSPRRTPEHRPAADVLPE